MKTLAVLFGSISLAILAVAQAPPPLLDALTRPQHYEARRSSSCNPDLESNGDSLPIPAGKSITLLDADGPGVVTHFWNTIGALDPFYGRSVVLRIYYDGLDQPSVQAPIGDFFGVGHGAHRSFTSATVNVSAYGLSRSCYWRMPFRKHIKVTVANESPTYAVEDFYYYIDWQKHERLPEDTRYFHAQYRQAMPATKGHYTILDTQGQGHYVGTVYSVQQVELGWFGEGDDFFYIDGAALPQLRGTGTEDYFNDAWGFREFCTPYHGVTLYEGVFPGDRVSAYRWHIADPIPFTKSLRATIEHRGSVVDETAGPTAKRLASSTERPDWISSVAFWYQYPPSAIAEALPAATNRVAPYQALPVGKLAHRAEPPELLKPSFIGVSYYPTGETASISFDFTADKAGRYRIDGMFEYALTSAIWQPYLDDRKLGAPIDMVVPESQYVWHCFDLHDLQAGLHTLKFVKLEARSPQARSVSFGGSSFTFEWLTLLRLEDLPGYHQLYDEKRKAAK